MKRYLAPDRRSALLGFAAASLLPMSARLVEAQTPMDDVATLDAFLDVLLPADAMSPAASTLNIGAEMLEIIVPDSLPGKLLSLGLTWLDSLDARRFATLPEETQFKVVTWMSQADVNEIPGRFYQVIRLFAVELYYARPGAITGFPLQVTPQPQGYPPPWT
ncbi:hypothetical protein PEL8287_01303 [Roseovarius litorisediminis]|uniref:Gluconate 2-dehydrogenase subunit 3 n=1 Tax=Roseovarius litorisediminis TaxID=1312363 RepID=A0A1Y5RYP0_9RHOB|nr:gluconate 2-dehydrogenase subunit 3 family protein [Roseovarius litorisediminis]SLN28632.1 hypothetical protein PEL8287_01303 [Roseovarius litorisediminis]